MPFDLSAPPDEVLQRWNVSPIEDLGGRRKRQWLVESAGSRLVLRGSTSESFAGLPYELEVLRNLYALGWPVPELVQDPAVVGGQTWCLFSHLPGSRRPSAETSDERIVRGRLLAELHESTAGLAELGQREGFLLSDEVVRDPELLTSLRAYENLYPAEANIMRWHLDRTLESFARIDLDSADAIVLHSDFTPWNLLFDDKNLTGILDFEATHLNFRVADFALAWRGEQDELIHGYEQVHRLTDLDWQLLIPVYWSWLFLGVKAEIRGMMTGRTQAHRFEWQIKHFLRRSELFGQHAFPYPGGPDAPGT